MNRIKAFAIASCLGLLAAAFVPARADEWNKKTILTVNEPVALPNTVLQPGKYVMKLADSPSNRHIVQVFDEGEQKLITTILAIPNERLRPADNTAFSYWETASDQPRALRSWFYPGDNFGQEFAYPKEMAMKIAKATNENVPAIMNDTEDVTKAEVRTMTPSGEAQEMSAQSTQSTTEHQATTNQSSAAAATTTAQAGTASRETAQSGMTSSTSAPTQTPSTSTSTSTPSTETSTTGAINRPMNARSELPQTASPFPLTGLAGLGAAAAALAARAVSKR